LIPKLWRSLQPEGYHGRVRTGRGDGDGLMDPISILFHPNTRPTALKPKNYQFLVRTGPTQPLESMRTITYL